MMTRKKILKMIGVEAEWIGTFTKIDERGENVMLVNVTHKGKEFTDHLWIPLHEKIEKIELGTKVRFLGTGKTYTDNVGRRKHGLNRCHNFQRYDETYFDSLDDGAERAKRVKRMNRRVRK